MIKLIPQRIQVDLEEPHYRRLELFLIEIIGQHSPSELENFGVSANDEQFIITNPVKFQRNFKNKLMSKLRKGDPKYTDPIRTEIEKYGAEIRENMDTQTNESNFNFQTNERKYVITVPTTDLVEKVNITLSNIVKNPNYKKANPKKEKVQKNKLRKNKTLTKEKPNFKKMVEISPLQLNLRYGSKINVTHYDGDFFALSKHYEMVDEMINMKFGNLLKNHYKLSNRPPNRGDRTQAKLFLSELDHSWGKGYHSFFPQALEIIEEVNIKFPN